MSNGWRLICYLIACAAFVVAAILSRTNKAGWSITFVSIGLAFIALVPLVDAIEAD
jgi:hypothetical protein